VLSVSSRIGMTIACAVIGACSGEATISGAVGGTPDDAGELRVGTLQAGEFAPGVAELGVENLSAGGQTSVAVDLVDAQGRRVTGEPFSASFSSECATQGLSRFDPATADSDTGRFTTTYIAQGCSGIDTIRVNVLIDGVEASAEATVDVSPPQLGSIEFVFAQSTVIGLVGSPTPNQAEVQFRVRDQTGGIVPNQRVDFGLSTTVGGLGVTPEFAVSDVNGVVRTFVRGGSIPTAVRVSATATLGSGQQFSTQSEQLAVSTGIPDQDSMSLAFDRLAVDGLCDGEPINVVIRMADRFNNPVPQGTAVNFRTEGGAIQSQCFTADPLEDPTEESGVCSVVMNVRNPRPDDGRASVLATALGEESFIDRNGNGFFDEGDSVRQDLPEAFLDENENGTRDADEPFVDTNEDQQYSAADGSFNGYVCDAPGVNCRADRDRDLVHVRDSGVVVFSTARAGVAVGCLDAPGGQCPFTPTGIAPGASVPLSFSIADANGQVPPTGTTYTLVVDGEGDIVEPATVGPFNTNQNSAQTVSFRYRAPDEAPEQVANVNLTLNVELPPSACSEAAVLSNTVATFQLIPVVE